MKRTKSQTRMVAQFSHSGGMFAGTTFKDLPTGDVLFTLPSGSEMLCSRRGALTMVKK